MLSPCLDEDTQAFFLRYSANVDESIGFVAVRAEMEIPCRRVVILSDSIPAVMNFSRMKSEIAIQWVTEFQMPSRCPVFSTAANQNVLILEFCQAPFEISSQ
jgi:hypothetical protein